ncbi:AGAP010350-PA, partial [Anopheles gambiae str. PEST]
TPDAPYETQTAQCTITSGDIEASAQASISKTLVGVCGTDEMLEAFRMLEIKMLEEIYNLRKMIRDPYFNPPPLRPSIYKSIRKSATSSNTSSNTTLPQSNAERSEGSRLTVTESNKKSEPTILATTTPSSKVVFPDDYDDEDEEDSHEFSKNGPLKENSELVKKLSSTGLNNTFSASRISLDDRMSSPAAPPIDFKPIDKPIEQKFLTGGLRDYEVYRFNNTVISSGDAKVFKYFWKIEHFMQRVRSASNMVGATFSSPVFVISGLNLRLHAKITTKSVGEILNVQLEQLSASDEALRKTPNVILASGVLYGQMETQKFFRNFLIFFFFYLQDKPFSDLISTDLTNTNAKFEAPLTALTTEPYLKDDKLLVKVIIFL